MDPVLTHPRPDQSNMDPVPTHPRPRPGGEHRTDLRSAATCLTFAGAVHDGDAVLGNQERGFIKGILNLRGQRQATRGQRQTVTWRNIT